MDLALELLEHSPELGQTGGWTILKSRVQIRAIDSQGSDAKRAFWVAEGRLEVEHYRFEGECVRVRLSSTVDHVRDPSQARSSDPRKLTADRVMSQPTTRYPTSYCHSRRKQRPVSRG